MDFQSFYCNLFRLQYFMEFCGIHGRFDSKFFAHLENEAIFTILGGFYMFKLPALAQAFYLKQ